MLAASKPVAVEKPEQVVPGSATAEKLASAPPVDTAAVDAEPAGNEPIDPAVMESGKAQYLVCAACHGANGEGSPIAPPLAASEWVTGPVSNLIRIQLRGLTGPITVAGKEYDFPGGMVAMPYQTDDQIAAVLTYIRNSFGNQASAVKPEQVNALRGEVGKPQLTVGDLVQP
jgi:mono/diheme cytochrome c family protein